MKTLTHAILSLLALAVLSAPLHAAPGGNPVKGQKEKEHKKEVKEWKKNGQQGEPPPPPSPIQVNKGAVKELEKFGKTIGQGVNTMGNAVKTNLVEPFVEKVGGPVVKFLQPVADKLMPVLNVVKTGGEFLNDKIIQPTKEKLIDPAVNAVNNGLQKLADSDNKFLSGLGKVGQVAVAGATAVVQVGTAPMRVSIETGKAAVKTVDAVAKGDASGALLGVVQVNLGTSGVTRVTDMGKTWEDSKKNVDKAVPGLGTVGGLIVESIPVVGDAVSAAGSAYKVQEAVKKGKYDEALGEAALAGIGLLGKGAGKAAAGAAHIAGAAAVRGATGIGGSRTLAAATNLAKKTESGIMKTFGEKVQGVGQSIGSLGAKTDSAVLKNAAAKLESKGDSVAKLANRADDMIAKATNTGAQDVALANKMLNKLDITTVADAQKLATNLNRVEKAADIVDMAQKAGDIKQAIDYATGAASPDDDDDDNKPDQDKKDDKKDDKPAAAGDPNANRAIALAPVVNNGGAAQAAPVNTNPVIAPSIRHSSNLAAANSFNSSKVGNSHNSATSAAIASASNLAAATPVIANGVIAPAPAPKPVVQPAPLPDPNSGGGNPNQPPPAGPAPGAHVAGGFDYIFKFFNDDDDDDTIHISSTTLTDLNHNDVFINANPDDASFGPILVPKGTHGVTLKGVHYGTTSPNDIKGTMRVLPGGVGAAVQSGGDQKFHLFIRDNRTPRDTQTLNVHAK